MSAPNAGRQSPPEERQSDIQQRAVPGSGKIGSSSRPAPEFSKQESENDKSKLASNPKHPLEDIEAAKFAKGSS